MNAMMNHVSGSVASSQPSESSNPSFSAPMGGNIGEGGIFGRTQPLPGSGPMPPETNPYNAGVPPYQLQPQQPIYQQQQLQQPPPYLQQHTYYGTGANAIPYGAAGNKTTIASPPAGSYAARSAQAHAHYNMGQPTVSITPPHASYQITQEQQQRTTVPPPPGAFTVQSPQVYQQIQQTPGSNAPVFSSPGTASPAGLPHASSSSYSARSQQAYISSGVAVPSNTQVVYSSQQPSYGIPPSTIASAPQVGHSTQNHTTQQQQTFQAPPIQQQQLQSSTFMPSANPPALQASGTPPTTPQVPLQGGYAARSAQAHAAVTGQQLPPVTNPYGQPSTLQQPNAAHLGDASVITNATATTGVTTYFGPGAAQSPQAQAVQQRLLTDATRKVQEHAYYMRQAMEQNNLPTVLDRAAYMVGELGVPPHGGSIGAGAVAPSLSNTGISVKLTPKNYYELYMRALEDMPSFEDYLLGLASRTGQQQTPMQPGMFGGETVPPLSPQPQHSYTMRELYDCVQYCPRVLPRLYLQISAGSALIRSGEAGPKWVLDDLIKCVKCEQNPIRGLFLRNYLLTVLRDKLPDTPAPSEPIVKEQESPEILDPGTVVDSYEFVMENFMEMNKLWVRLQHLPGDGNSKEVKKRRERERNDLRILVGTNLVRISQLEGVTSKIYGEAILPRVLDHVVVVGDPLSQAYLMDCLVQVFPDEYHIETLPILLNVCPRLRDKVNIRTILQGLMDRLANYLADEELLDEQDTNQVKLTLARDSFGMFDECVQKVYNSRGPKLTAKEVIRLQTALLQFSLKCYPGNLEQIARCMGACVSALQQLKTLSDLNNASAAAAQKSLDDVSVAELEKLLSIPLESLALRVLELDNYSELIGFLPWANRRAVARTLLEAVDKEGAPPNSIREIHQLFNVIVPLIRRQGALLSDNEPDPTVRVTGLMEGLGMVHPNLEPMATGLTFEDVAHETLTIEIEQECALVSKLVHLLDHEDTDVVYEMLNIAREHIRRGSAKRASKTMVAVVFASIKLARRIRKAETAPPPEEGIIGNSAEVVDSQTDPSSENKEGSIAENMDHAPTEVVSSEPVKLDTSAEENKDEAVPASIEEAHVVEDVVSELKKGLLGEESAQDGDALFAEDEKVEVEETKMEEKPVSTSGKAHNAEKNHKKRSLVSSRQVFLFMQETILLIGKANAEVAVKLLLEVALTADSFATGEGSIMFAQIVYDMLSQSYSLYEQEITDSVAQKRAITSMIGTLLSCKSVGESDYETLITKTAHFSAKLVNKSDQCQMVGECSHLFFPVKGGTSYSNPKRALECLQRSLKLADACRSTNTSQIYLFVDLLEHYVFFLENKNPFVNAAYVTGLCSLVKEYLRESPEPRAVSEARSHFVELVREIQLKKSAEGTASLFAAVEADTVGV